MGTSSNLAVPKAVRAIAYEPGISVIQRRRILEDKHSDSPLVGESREAEPERGRRLGAEQRHRGNNTAKRGCTKDDFDALGHSANATLSGAPPEGHELKQERGRRDRSSKKAVPYFQTLFLIESGKPAPQSKQTNCAAAKHKNSRMWSLGK